MRRHKVRFLLRVLGLVLLILVLSPYITSWLVNPNRNKFEDEIKARYEKAEREVTEGGVTELAVTERDMDWSKFSISAKIDWHDYSAMRRDSKRVGIGEQGKAAYIKDDSQKELEEQMSLLNGFNALLSDMISVNRSVPDLRLKKCRFIKYHSHLPTVSIVIPFHNEQLSVLKRTLHSIVNRTPAHLLKEIILVDDNSNRYDLFEPLVNYLHGHFGSLVHIIRMPRRTGLIKARLAGAHKAIGQVLVFFDSHIECNHNWLPPLIEPIAINKRVSTCPYIDVIDDKTFAYEKQDDGSRGAFDWTFDYKRLPLLKSDLVDPTKPSRNPIMAGGLFAISADFFWELGGYDEELDIWGGEQYELSFKIWMCGGELLDVPCSRVAHVYRGPWEDKEPIPRPDDFLHRNYKRVAEVWMDEYKTYLYQRGMGAYEKVDAGDLTKQKAIRDSLHCKSFKWYLENIAFDLVKLYPYIEPPEYAHGAIQSVADPQLCVDTLGRDEKEEIGLFYCAEDLEQPQETQNFALSWQKDLRKRFQTYCLDTNDDKSKNVPIVLWECHYKGGSQHWHYDREHKWLVQGKRKKWCLEADVDKKKLYVNICKKNNIKMKWNFGVVNDTALDMF